MNAFAPKTFILGDAFGYESAFGIPLGGGDLTPENVQATAGDKQTTLTWDADDNLGYAVYFSRTNNFAGAQLYSAFVPAATVSYDVAASVNSDPASSSVHAVGTFYYYWVCGTDGAGNVVTDPSTVVSARPYITVSVSETVGLYVPDAAAMTIGTVLFAQNALGVGSQIQANGTSYEFDAVNWIDLNTFNPGDSDPISGNFTVVNNSASAITFWDTEP